MIEVIEIAVEGKTEGGLFRGSFQFGGGLQVLSGPNRYGKSLAFAALTWCLGVEHIFGVQPNDNSIFPDAARSRVVLGGAEESVLESAATVALRRNGSDVLRLRRNIMGEVDRISYADGDQAGNLLVGRGSLTDTTAGFQAVFRRWANLPDAHLKTSRGGDAAIYLENLAPLFLIEQLAGWADIQSEQVHRYGTLEIREGAFEYLLGLTDSLAARLRRQGSAAEAAAVREEARSIAHDFSEVTKAQGWDGTLSVTGALDAVITRWRDLDVVAFVEEKFHFDAAKEQRRLVDRVDALRSRITKGKIDTETTAETADASGRVVAMKQRRHELQLLLSTLRAQLTEQQRLHGTIEGRLKSAKDLRRFKVEHIGILPKAECPTCHQSVDPAHLELSPHSAESLDVHVAQLDRERLMLAANTERLRGEVLDAATQANRLEDEFGAAEQSLKMVNQTVGPARATLVKLSGDLIQAERDLQRSRDLQVQLHSLQARIRQWVDRAKGAAADDSAVADDKEPLTAFLTRFRKYVVDLGCAGVPEDSAYLVKVDESYVPTFHGRLLRSFGSASDRARLVTAYVTALNEVGQQHPGFVVLDEPLQQNPDEKHRDRFLHFLAADAATMKRQAIVFTALDSSQVQRLQKAGVAVRVLEGKFLRRVEPPPEDKKAEPSGSGGDWPVTPPQAESGEPSAGSSVAEI